MDYFASHTKHGGVYRRTCWLKIENLVTGIIIYLTIRWQHHF